MIPAVLPIIALTSVVLLLIIFGIIEYQGHQRILAEIPMRIHINGTRGKSSVTRLVAAGLRAGGIRTFAKTTGTAPRVIDAEGKDHIIHRLRKPSIGEQVRLLRFFAREKVDAVVMECMAVQPQYQWISEQQMVKSQIGVITNVRPDYLDEMGPTTEDIALSLSNSIPRNGTFITAENTFFPQLAEVAKRRKSRSIQVAENTVNRSDLQRFSYLEHPQNVALSLAVCEQLGIDRKTALDGMVTVQPDLGALVAWRLKFDAAAVFFINSMAANDPVSTLNIWSFVIDRYPVEGDVCVFLNTRDDRQYRTKQLLQLTMEHIKPDHFVVRGSKIDSQIKHLAHYSPGTEVHIVDSEAAYSKVLDAFKLLADDSLIFAIGNQVGAGQNIVNMIRKHRRDL